MQVTTANDVKVYNLSVGKTLPEWISDRKKRTLLKNDVGKASNVPIKLCYTPLTPYWADAGGGFLLKRVPQ